MTADTPSARAQRAKELAERATPGEWRVEQGTALVWGDCQGEGTFGMGFPVAEAWLNGR